MDTPMSTVIRKAPYAEPLCEWSRLEEAHLVCQSPGGIEDIEIEDWIDD